MDNIKCLGGYFAVWGNWRHLVKYKAVWKNYDVLECINQFGVIDVFRGVINISWEIWNVLESIEQFGVIRAIQDVGGSIK